MSKIYEIMIENLILVNHVIMVIYLVKIIFFLLIQLGVYNCCYLLEHLKNSVNYQKKDLKEKTLENQTFDSTYSSSIFQVHVVNQFINVGSP